MSDPNIASEITSFDQAVLAEKERIDKLEPGTGQEPEAYKKSTQLVVNFVVKLKKDLEPEQFVQMMASHLPKTEVSETNSSQPSFRGLSPNTVTRVNFVRGCMESGNNLYGQAYMGLVRKALRGHSTAQS